MIWQEVFDNGVKVTQCGTLSLIIIGSVLLLFTVSCFFALKSENLGKITFIRMLNLKSNFYQFIVNI